MEAEFPILAANLVDQQTGELVNWDNVQPSILIDVDSIKVGIIGVMTARALQRTIALNVGGLEVAPLAEAIIQEATALREAGANLVIVTAHAGSECTEFSDPNDLTSCHQDGEIFDVARNLPAGLVDHIIAGHVHQGVAHVVNGIAVTSAYASTRAFSRVDFSIDRRSGQVLSAAFIHHNCLSRAPCTKVKQLSPTSTSRQSPTKRSALAREMRESKVGIKLTTPFTLWGNPESSLGNLFTDALFATVDADAVIHNVAGGLRTGLPAGDLQFGDVYELSPFENRVVLIDLSGAQLRKVVAEQAHNGIRSIGFSGMKVFVQCNDRIKTVDIFLSDGQVVNDDDTVTIAVNDYIATGGDNILTSVMPDGGFPIDESQPLTRDLFIAYLTARGGDIAASDFDTGADPKWNRPEDLDPECRLEL